MKRKKVRINSLRASIYAFSVTLLLFSRHILRQLRGNFLYGLGVLLPTAVTVFITVKIFNLAIEQLGVLYKQAIPWWLGLIVMCLIVGLVGLIARIAIGRQVMSFFDRLFTKIPVVKNIYTTIKQLQEIFTNKKMLFEKVVMLQYPRKGIYSLGFLTAQAARELEEKSGEDDMVTVFLSTTPNPTSGLLVFIPRKDIIPLDMNTEEAFKLIISGGIITPDDIMGKTEPADQPRKKSESAGKMSSETFRKEEA